jgi:hypothetical protein
VNDIGSGFVTRSAWNLGRSGGNPDMTRYMEMVAPVSAETWITVHHRVWSEDMKKFIFPGNAHKKIRSAMDDTKYWSSNGFCVYLSQGMYRNYGPKPERGIHPRADRTYQNLVSCKNLYLDVDAKEDGGYPSTAEVAAAVKGFIVWSKLPFPTVIVGSGSGGWHIYWTLDTAVDRTEFTNMARRLVTAGVEYGLKFDRQCTVDATRLLRVPGTWNFKYADPDKGIQATPVVLHYCADGKHIDVGLIKHSLSRWPSTVTHEGKSAPVTGVDVHGFDLSDTLTGEQKLEYAPANIDEVAKHCPFIKNTLEVGGDNLVGEPQWHDVIALACHCAEPLDTLTRLTKDNQYYIAEGAEHKLAIAQQDRVKNPNLGPPKCAHISIERDECKTCPHLVLGTTPLSVAFRVGAALTLASKFAPTQPATGEGVRLQDFVAFMQSEFYIFVPSGDYWPASRVDARVRGVPLVDANGAAIVSKDSKKPVVIKASNWLAEHAPVEQMTWAPGLLPFIRDKLINKGGWIDRKGVTIFNLYRPPTLTHGDASLAGPWIDHIVRVYPEDAGHIVNVLAHRVQKPQEKINHGLVLGGHPGIGKDTILEPVKYAIGPWNFAEASPANIVGRFNGYLQSVILRISEAKDLGDVDRYKFYEHTKTMLAAPPDMLRIDEKNIKEYYIFNIPFVIMTTNHKTNGIYLPADDRRHYVAWSDLKPTDFEDGYWEQMEAYPFDSGSAICSV